MFQSKVIHNKWIAKGISVKRIYEKNERIWSYLQYVSECVNHHRIASIIILTLFYFYS